MSEMMAMIFVIVVTVGVVIVIFGVPILWYALVLKGYQTWERHKRDSTSRRG